MFKSKSKRKQTASAAAAAAAAATVQLGPPTLVLCPRTSDVFRFQAISAVSTVDITWGCLRNLYAAAASGTTIDYHECCSSYPVVYLGSPFWGHYSGQLCVAIRTPHP